MLSNKFMVIAILAALIATLLSAISLISIDESTTVLQNLSWAHGRYSLFGFDTDVYVGVFQFGMKESTNNDDQHQEMKYTDDNCNPDFCEKCHKEMPIVYGFLAGFCLFSLFSIFSNFSRYRDDGNTRGHRNSGIGASLVAIGCGLVSLIYFASGCFKEIEGDYPSSYDWEYGASFCLLAAAVCLKVVDILVNMLVSVAGVMGCC